MIRLEGPVVAKARQIQLRERIAAFSAKIGRAPGLAVVIVGEDPASQVYVRNKVKTCGQLGIQSFHYELPATITEDELRAKVVELNQDPSVDGILVQLPLPKHINSEVVLNTIKPEKDPDGLTFGNLGMLFAGRKRVAPCTPWGR